MLKIKSFSLLNSFITNELLSTYVTQFWNEILPKVKANHHLLVMCRVKFSDSTMGHRTLGHMRRVTFADKQLFIEYLTNRFAQLDNSYAVNSIEAIEFTYIFGDGLPTNKDRALLQNISNKEVSTHRFNNMNLPLSNIPSDYGDVQTDQVMGTITRYIVTDNKRTFRIDIALDKSVNTVTILGPTDLTWTDTLSDFGFIREIGKTTLYIADGEIVLRKQQLSAKAFRHSSKDNEIKNNFVTMDIETVNIEGDLKPYLLCAYNGNDYISSFADSGIDNQELLFKNFMDQLFTLIPKEGTLYVYVHNFSGFDGIFLLKHLISPKIGTVDPLFFNGKLLTIKVKLNIDKYKGKTIIFKDSYLLLPLSLRSLCKAFNIEEVKGYFPFLLTNILYKGVFPALELFTNITLSEYDNLLSKYSGKIWSFKDESIKYCNLDCKVLYEVIIKFNELIFNQFQLNVHVPVSLPALAMKIYKTHYMPKDTIYQLLGTIEHNIRQSYTGGAVDTFIPHNRAGNFYSKVLIPLFYYDINSLYPTIMATCMMPVGKPIYFEGNIRHFNPNAFGIFYCKITSPDNMLHPLLQRKIQTVTPMGGIRTIAGLGSWEGWIFSEEMDNAIRNGYRISVIKGYEFQKANIFKKYVETMYQLRQQYLKGHPMNLIAKLLMNSLYGKFGMKLEQTKVNIYDTTSEYGKAEALEAVNTFGESIVDYVELDDSLILVRNTLANIKYNEQDDYYHGVDINIAVAASITAAARVYMSKFKNNPDYNLYYSDTDSIVIDRPLPNELIGNELGFMKLEYVIDKNLLVTSKLNQYKLERYINKVIYQFNPEYFTDKKYQLYVQFDYSKIDFI